MGRRAREERQEEREDKVAKQTKVKRKNNLKAVGILTLIAIIVGYAGYEFMNMDSNVPVRHLMQENLVTSMNMHPYL